MRTEKQADVMSAWLCSLTANQNEQVNECEQKWMGVEWMGEMTKAHNSLDIHVSCVFNM